MWEFTGQPGEPLFLVIAAAADDERPFSAPPDLTEQLRERLVLYGELRSIEDETPVGVALALPAPSRAAVDVLLREGGAGLDEQPGVRVFDWEFGGRR
jgi:hypothetical protein